MVRLMFETVVVTFGMFSALPMPRVDWTPHSMRWALACLPLVGFACGGALALWLAVCRLLNLSGLLPAAGICLCPLLVTGGLHMDGFADTCDALASHAEPARKQEILKDSHVENLKSSRGYFLFSNEEREISSEESNEASEEWFDTSEEFSVSSVEIFYFPASYLEISSEEIRFVGGE